jgi:hypothetical protein
MTIGWVVIAGFIIYKTNFFRELWENPHRVMFFFTISLFCFCTNLALLLYMTAYIPFIRKVPAISIDFEKDCPKLIPIVTILGIVSFFTYRNPLA